ncbi:acyl-CoA dehydrogenase [Aquisalimonas lutea]|uniref:acyl-CoA dehydrogenase family protein n=1 Tax=Aquisalimonas lutea TaxID=1327750 RepID=UPI0025B55C2F|nr:acyl-CoA dehydrogenase [Aquisalimonas lutea]MDN3518794.1 acyl-CoA dehydrogenase [Aquisalimonas lutea]
MDFSLTDEQRMLQDTVERLVQDQYGFEQRRGYMQAEGGFTREMWNQFAELGLLGVPFAEELGGFGGGPVETMLVMEAFGKGLVLEPYVASVVTTGQLIADAGSDAQKSAVLEPLVSGELILAFAHGEPDNRYSNTQVATRAERSGSGYTLHGHKTVVLHGDSADRLVVSARTSGDTGDASGVSLFLVDAGAPGVSVQGYATIDGLHAAEVRLDGVQVGEDALVGAEGGAVPLIELTQDRGAFAVCAEAVGAMSVACDLTLDYLKQRKQFGVPIGSFQSVQHRMVEMRMELEQSRSATYKAAAKLDSDDPAARRRAVSIAKYQVGKGGRFVSEQSIQLHGGIGMTEEYNLSHFAKRIAMIDNQFGDADAHMDRFSEQMEVPAAG